MGIESKYEYIYYTVINTSEWMHGNEEWFGDEFTWDAAVNFVQHKLKTSEDESVKKIHKSNTPSIAMISDFGGIDISTSMKKCLSSLSFGRTKK